MPMTKLALALAQGVLAMAAQSDNLHPTFGYPVANAENYHGEFRGEFFEVDSPTLRMRYSEVAWRTLDAVDLPANIVARFANKTMAVTGFEVDVRRITDESSGAWESVPAYQSYNHHYSPTLVSAAAKLRVDEFGLPVGKELGHGKVLEYEIREGFEEATPADARLAYAFVHGNGQEHRQIFHGTSVGYAQPIFNPAQFVFTPMQISTNDGTGRRGPGGPIPKFSRDTAPPDAPYSPLLECPCTTRNAKPSSSTYNANCKPEPLSDLVAQKNPTCEAASYLGGLSCCGDGNFLLDADQEVPAFVDAVFFRFRFYFSEWDDETTTQIDHVEWAQNGCDSGNGGPSDHGCTHIEFDVLKGAGSDAGPDIQQFQSTFKAGDMLATSCAMSVSQCMDGSRVSPKGFKLIQAAAHCHAPNCLRQDLKNLDTNETICSTKPIHGQTEQAFDEEGYLWAPPCLWGSAEEGLPAPPLLAKDANLQMITWFNSTYGHAGQMGIWQMKAAY